MMLQREMDARARQVRARALRCDTAGAGVATRAFAGDEGDQALRSLEEQLEHVELQRASAAMRSAEAALRTLEVGRYGVCQHCEETIPSRRLRALPTAILCLECQEAAERLRASIRSPLPERAHPAVCPAARPPAATARRSRKAHAGLTPA
jgi:RNA polymerase-binding transcription factor DksA